MLKYIFYLLRAQFNRGILFFNLFKSFEFVRGSNVIRYCGREDKELYAIDKMSRDCIYSTLHVSFSKLRREITRTSLKLAFPRNFPSV